MPIPVLPDEFKYLIMEEIDYSMKNKWILAALSVAASSAVSAVIAYKKGYKDGNFKKISDENMYVDDEDADKEYNLCSDSDDKFSV
ncbi:MAG: hypothetical protein PUE12_17200 [Oscillospiraceae bacterium]|nr:hypothetical protein [Oscillospiraceae bacterium]